MTVEQLIEKLRSYPSSSPVLVETETNKMHIITNIWSFRPVADWSNPPGTVPFVVIDVVERE